MRHGGKAYQLTGVYAQGTPVSDFYEYDPDPDRWTRLANFGPGDGNAGSRFALNGVIYGGQGISDTREDKQEVWRYIEELQ